MARVEQQTSSGQGFLGHVHQMLRTHPGPSSLDREALLECIQACLDCAQSCISCADACLGEKDPSHMVRCIRLNQDCANICEATGKILSRQTAFEPAMAQAILQACVAACRLCGDECERHAQTMEHCRVCAEACRRCEQACQRLLAAA
jgi:hypothetical protein